MGETQIMNQIKDALNSFISMAQVFRNNIGRFKNIDFGLKKGAADLIGWQTIKITPKMVGKNVAIFLSVEVKDTGKKIIKGSDQEEWMDLINRSGGIAIEADSREVALKRIGYLIDKLKS